jgi:hypothetical protein
MPAPSFGPPLLSTWGLFCAVSQTHCCDQVAFQFRWHVDSVRLSPFVTIALRQASLGGDVKVQRSSVSRGPRAVLNALVEVHDGQGVFGSQRNGFRDGHALILSKAYIVGL